jgi:hypothetical protein
MSKPARIKPIITRQGDEDLKRRQAEERARARARTKRGTAANILASADTFGAASSAASRLGAGGVLG